MRLKATLCTGCAILGETAAFKLSLSRTRYTRRDALTNLATVPPAVDLEHLMQIMNSEKNE